MGQKDCPWGGLGSCLHRDINIHQTSDGKLSCDSCYGGWRVYTHTHTGAVGTWWRSGLSRASSWGQSQAFSGQEEYDQGNHSSSLEVFQVKGWEQGAGAGLEPLASQLLLRPCAVSAPFPGTPHLLRSTEPVMVSGLRFLGLNAKFYSRRLPGLLGTPCPTWHCPCTTTGPLHMLLP